MGLCPPVVLVVCKEEESEKIEKIGSDLVALLYETGRSVQPCLISEDGGWSYNLDTRRKHLFHKQGLTSPPRRADDFAAAVAMGLLRGVAGKSMWLVRRLAGWKL
ncbi:hypothetical protein U1Q18_000737 [Sarracenia purpurea var. burkii]